MNVYHLFERSNFYFDQNKASFSLVVVKRAAIALAVMSAIPCANPNCDTGNPGKSKCAACGTVSYCGPACQKAHWSVHKGPCKAKTKSLSSSGSASPTSPLSPVVQPKALVPNSVPDHNGVIARLTASKNRTQTAFQSSDFEEAVTASNESIAIAKEIPDPGQSVELIQILLNLSSAHLQLGQSDLAESASLKCLEMAEKALILRNNHPHAIDMLQVALVNRGFMLLNVNKIDAAVAAATRALELAETIFGDNKMDPRFFKPLRCLGVSFTKQEKWEDAEKPLTRAYIIALKAGGACNGDTQTALEELIQVLMKKGDNAKAVQYSKKNFEALSQSELDRYHPGIGEAAARYASILATVKREAEAEPIMQRALEIREKAHGSQHQIVGMTLMAVANLRETMGNVGSETEGMLMRALEIFKRLDESEGGGMSGQHTVNAVNFIRRVRAKREGVSFTDEQEEAEKVIDAAAAPRTSSPKASAPQVSRASFDEWEFEIENVMLLYCMQFRTVPRQLFHSPLILSCNYSMLTLT